MTQTLEIKAASAPDMAPAALVALVIGALAIGASPILVRWADVGPFAAAFWRVALALPILALWAGYERAQARRVPAAERRRPPLRSVIGLMMVPGALFAGDLIFWHLSILNTTVANATLLANFAPVVVTLGAWMFLREHITRAFVIGLVVAMAGALLLMGASFSLNPDNLSGDLYGLVTACFFGGYVLSVRKIRDRVSAAELMFASGVVTALVLLAVSLVMGDRFWPQDMNGWVVLIALAWISHAGGQGLLAYALGHLPASFTSLVILLEPVAAAILGWLLLAEVLTPLQGLGGAVVLAGVLIARRASR